VTSIPLTRCHLCDSEPESKRRYQREGLASGKECPICYEPTCRFHLTTVRWRWKNGGGVDADRICKECKRTYRHRSWDTLNRDWIS
jgi:hypothetical protein